MTSMRRRYIASTSLQRHVPAGNLAPLGPPNILNLPSPMTMISSVDLAHYGVSRAKDWVSVDCGTVIIIIFISMKNLSDI